MNSANTAWTVLAISAGTDFIISFGNALVSSMVEGKTGELPSSASLLIACLGALVAFARTIQQGLKAAMGHEEMIAKLTTATAPKPPVVQVFLGVVMVALALGVTGCATPGAPTGPLTFRGDPVAALERFTVLDLEAAIRLAVAGEDDAAKLCYEYVLGEVRLLHARRAAGAPTSPVAGPVSVVQQFRNGIHGPTTSTSRSLLGKLDLHCAAYRTSVEIDLVRGAMLGAAVAGGDVAGLLPALKTMAPLLGINLP
jgi:hypothetical protein